MLRRLFIAFQGAILILAGSGAQAADLKVSLAELAELTRPLVRGAQIRLHNTPGTGLFGGLFASANGSSITIAGQTQSFELTPYTFPLTGIGSGRYAYYFNDINTSQISLRHVSGALRLTVRFESEQPELVGSCFSGTCGFSRALPIINWRNPRVDVDLVPITYRGGITLSVKRVRVHGVFQTRCRTRSFLCTIGRQWAQRQINAARTREMPRRIAEAFNTTANRDRIAAAVNQFLRFGPETRVTIRKLSVGKSTMNVSFRF